MRANNLITGSNSIILERNEVIRKNFIEGGNADSDIPHYFTLNTELDSSKKLKVIYLLPVDTTDNYAFGRGILETQKLMIEGSISDNVLFIEPDLNTTPWFGNHPTNVKIQQEDNMVELFDKINYEYSFFKDIEVTVLGFSKSGWGAMSMQLNFPEYIDNALIWDAPLDIYSLNYGMSNVFVTNQYFRDNYFLNDELITKSNNLIGKTIVIGGYDLFSTSSNGFMSELNNYPLVNYISDATMVYAHTWDKRWIKDLLYYVNL